MREDKAASAARGDLENERRASVASLGEVQLVAPRKVLSAIDPINSGLQRAYDAINRLEDGKSLPDDSFEKIHQSLEGLLEQWIHMSDAMRHDLGAKDLPPR